MKSELLQNIMAMDIHKIITMAPVVGIAIIILLGFIFALCIKSVLKRKGIFKLYMKEPLEAHMRDPLNLDRWEKAKSFSTDTYFAKEMMQYAIQLGTNNVKKRNRYTKEGEPTPQLQASINESKLNMVQAFTHDGRFMSEGYCHFISDYRPHYMVGDFPKTITEYMAFCVNPGAFQKVERQPEPEKEPENTVPVAPSTFVDESQNSDIDVYEDPYEEEYVQLDDEGISFSNNATMVTPYSAAVSVGRDITMALSCYAERLAKKTCSKKQISAEENGVKTKEFRDECSRNYDRLSKIFLEKGCFKNDFVTWANSEYSDYGVEHFEELIAPYLKFIKER